MAQGVFKDYTGQLVGYWEVLARLPSKNRGSRWRCRCICGAIKIKTGGQLCSRDSGQCAKCHRAGIKPGQDREIERYRAVKAMYQHQRAARVSL